MKAFVSGIVGIETSLAVRGFPVTYYPVDYPFFGITTAVAGSGYRVARALSALGDTVDFLAFVGDDINGKRVHADITARGMSGEKVYPTLTDTVEAVLLQEVPFGRRQIYCDLKDLQDKKINPEHFCAAIAASDVCVLCNVNYNRPLLHLAKELGKPVVTDVQNLSDINDPFNSEFIDAADILFLNSEGVPNDETEFLRSLAGRCKAGIIVMGLSSSGLICYRRDTDAVVRLNAVNVGNVLTVGAGANLMAGFAHYYGKFDCIEALKRAEVFTALKLVRNSDAAYFPSEEEVEEKLRECGSSF